MTSCPFADQVRAAYFREGGGSSVVASPPVTEPTYPVDCAADFVAHFTDGSTRAPIRCVQHAVVLLVSATVGILELLGTTNGSQAAAFQGGQERDRIERQPHLLLHVLRGLIGPHPGRQRRRDQKGEVSGNVRPLLRRAVAFRPR